MERRGDSRLAGFRALQAGEGIRRVDEGVRERGQRDLLVVGCGVLAVSIMKQENQTDPRRYGMLPR